jgi:hypothetical protein
MTISPPSRLCARLERVFDVEVAAEEVSRVMTVGNFHDLLLSIRRGDDCRGSTHV